MPVIGAARTPKQKVDWERENRKKKVLQLTLLGFMAMFGGLFFCSQQIEALPVDSKLRQALGTAMVAWVVLIFRSLWSLVWFPVPKAGSDGAATAAAGGNGAEADGDSSDEDGTTAAGRTRRRRVRRET